MNLNWLWLIPAVSFAVFEAVALADRKDKFHPATYWIRRLLMLRNRWAPLYWGAFGFWLWLGVHFFIDG